MYNMNHQTNSALLRTETFTLLHILSWYSHKINVFYLDFMWQTTTANKYFVFGNWKENHTWLSIFPMWKYISTVSISASLLCKIAETQSGWKNCVCYHPFTSFDKSALWLGRSHMLWSDEHDSSTTLFYHIDVFSVKCCCSLPPLMFSMRTKQTNCPFIRPKLLQNLLNILPSCCVPCMTYS